MTEESADVLVVGAGLGGLSASMFLAQHGVRVLTVERHPGTSIHPRAAGQTPRTMELYRFAGIDGEVRGVSKRASEGLRITVASSLNGQVLHRIVEDVSEIDLSAAVGVPWGMAGQDVVEPILLARAREFGAEVRFSTELVSFEQDEDGITAVLGNGVRGHAPSGGAEAASPQGTGKVRAKYLIGADGGRGRIRERLGITTEGVGSIGHSIGVVFDADLGDRVQPDVTDLFYLQHAEFTGALVNTDIPNRFVFSTDFHPESGEKAEDFTPERLTGLIRLATGLPGLKPDIRWSGTWETAARIATTFRSGRVFLVGDAAKVTPPTGGMGGNTAVGDGHDIAWKLAAVLRGEAGPGLLDSYQAERKPFAEMVVATSLHNAKHRLKPDLDLAGVPEPVDQLELALGYRCRSAAVLPDDDDPRPVENPNAPTGRAGFRAPHVPITVDGTSMSTVDILGRGWVLIATGEGWRQAAEKVTAETGIDATCRELGVDFADPQGVFLARYGLRTGGATLVRPDGVVAWRTVRGVEAPHALGVQPPEPHLGAGLQTPSGTLRKVLTQVLAR